MWRRKRQVPLSDTYLPGGRSYFAVIDVEALVMDRIDVVEQVAIVLVDLFGREVLGEKHMIYQPLDSGGLSRSYGVGIDNVQKAIDGYRKVTRDDYIHRDPFAYERWGPVRKRLTQICRDYAVAVYAKGIALEYRVFYGELPFWDLAWWSAPKYPGEVHDPLCECRFFSQYIPDLIRNPVYIC